MPPSIRQHIEAWRENSDTSGSLTFIVGVTDATSDEVLAKITSVGAEIEDNLGYDFLRISGTDDEIARVESLDVVTSVEIEGSGRMLDEGNSHSPSGSIQ